MLALAAPAQAVVRVDTDTSRAPQAQAMAARAQQLVREWGPKINRILYGSAGATLETVRIVYEPQAGADGALSHVRDGVIYMAASAAVIDPDNVDAMLVHDLTHLYQHDLAEGKWLIEGMADYIRHRHFARDLSPTLRINAQGHLQGYGARQSFLFWLQDNAVDLRARGYLAGNTVTASFLYWVELNKNQDIVRLLASAIRDGAYGEAVWTQATGATLDSLWQQFLKASQT